MAHATTPTTMNVGALLLLPHLNYGVLCGAFAGATLFILSTKESSTLTRFFYLIPSLFIGIASAGFTAQLLQKMLSKCLALNLVHLDYSKSWVFIGKASVTTAHTLI